MITITFKDKNVLENFFNPMHLKLVTLFLWVVSLAEHLEEAIVVTCAYEYRGKNSTSVHSTMPFRGLDLREWILKNPKAFEKSINEKWIYDPKRPHLKCARIHKNRSRKGRHLHLQVHPNTRRIV